MAGWIEGAFPLFQTAAVVCVVVWLALAVALYLKKSRKAIGRVYVWTSVVTALYCWMLSFIVTYRTLGMYWLVVGLLLAGVGVIPLAFVGEAERGFWWEMPKLFLALALVLAPRLFGAWLLGEFEPPAKQRARSRY